ncbi:MAG: flagellar hook-associated protein FlgL [Bdellovibrionaceae bacterium]|nr:flagellar hook-associated protein FlgL [Bdellovibrionales bacterium]MCB9084876.1 flagellar hook-associated protein FlgL [Pseudobdellovibrionaceae bacterium]
MRIADKMNYEQVKQNLAKNRTEMAHLQNQAATQKRVTKPSDDPVAAARVLASRVELAGTRQYLKNLDFARSFLEYTDQSLSELTEQLVRAKELALSQANDASANELSRDVVATEIEQIYNQIVQIGNRQHGDRYVFGGFKTTTTPFAHSGSYAGDMGEMMVHVDKGSFLAMNLPGAKVFLGQGLSKDGVSHASEQQARTIEEFQDQRRANRTDQPPGTYGPGKGAPNGNGPQMRGPASENANTGTHTRGVRENPNQEAEAVQPQDRGVDAPHDGVNLFGVITRLSTGLRANDKGVVQDTLDRLDAAISQVVMARSQVGSRVMTLNSAMETLQKSKVDSQSSISQLEDVDAFEVVSDMNKTESTLQATLATSGKLIEKSLLDFVG